MFKKINKKSLFVFLLVLGVFLLSFQLAGAQDFGNSYAVGTGLGEEDPRNILTNLVNLFFTFLGILSVIIIMYAGFLWMTSNGREDRVEKAKKTLIGAIIGLILILASWAIVSFVLNVIGGQVTGNCTNQSCDNCPGVVCGPGFHETGGMRYCDANNNLGPCQGCTCEPDETPPGPTDCDADLGTPGVCSNPDNDACDSDEFCDHDTCTCQSQFSLGAPCSASTTTCVPDHDVCLSQYCDNSCVCSSSPVIYSVSPVGGFCDNNTNTPCSEDDDCPSGDTCNTDTPNGAEGNLVTIGGHYFGTTTGDVYFNNEEANLPAGDCSQFALWTENQVVVVVPTGIDATNSIEVIRDDGLSDTTSNNVGPQIPDFLRNNIERPGLCGIDPNHGQIGDNLDYVGLNLSGSTAYMGNYRQYVEAYNSTFNDPEEGTAEVPSVETGTTSTFASSSGIYSNYLDFHKDEEPYSGPYITSFDPVDGPPGTYVTINGSGFGSSQGGSAVYFGTTTNPGNEASYDFPEVCADSVWSNTQVVVKVPQGMTAGNRLIYMDIQGEGVISTAGGSVSPSTFAVETGEPDPGLCKIRPTMGPSGVPLSLWGEYFGNDTGSVLFSPGNLPQNNINLWESNSGQPAVADKVETLVPQEAISGPVRVYSSDSSTSSNPKNFEIGLCTEAGNRQEQNAACGPDICCPTGTYKAGRCATSTENCYVDIPNSVFEWEFNTGSGTTSPDPDSPDSCQERSQIEGSCDPDPCPNTSGECSFNEQGIEITGNQCGDGYCSSLSACSNSSYNDCEYNSSYNACLATTSGYINCDLPSNELNGNPTENILGDPVTITCSSEGYWYFPGNLSCPGGWNMTPGGGCINYSETCNSCESEFSCLDDGSGQGYCGTDYPLCSEEADCINGECISTTSPICECCCRVENSTQDCCSFQYENSLGDTVTESLDCAGVCGEDTNPDDDSGYGLCTGCRIDQNDNGIIESDNNNNIDEFALSDEACICEDNTGQFCDIHAGEDLDGDGNPDGVCRDCSVLSGKPDFCSEHSTCCVDAVSARENECRGYQTDIVESNGIGYCGYYHCTVSGDTCSSTAGDYGLVASSTFNNYDLFTSTTTCDETCTSSPEGLGESCEALGGNDVCNVSICGNPYQCIDGSGATVAPGTPSTGGTDCGYCCCDPNAAAPGDCVAAGLTGLNCQADQSPCTGPDRGLCCGCSQDSDCGNPSTTGCGSDTCCRARPEVSTTNPSSNEVGICANAQITATFDSSMKISSFTGNVIVAGEYDGACPKNTTYLAQAPKNTQQNFLARFWEKIKFNFKYAFSKLAVLFTDRVLAWPVDTNANYCAVPGSVSGENTANGNTRLTFSPSILLDTDTRYFVIIRGDENLDSSRGVRSYWDIGMNENSNDPDSNIANTLFNGVDYPNSYIWSFETLDDQGTQGVCEIDHVDIDPDSYLFKTTENSLVENDDDPNDDSVSSGGYDRDKFFHAQAKTADNQTVIPVPGVYDWTWSWGMDTNIINTTGPGIPAPLFNAGSSTQQIIAQEGVQNNYSDLTAQVNLGADIYNYGGNGITGTSTVWVFLCNNPWPPFSSAGTWLPWQDAGGNCDLGGSCHNTNYQFYYCRDQGEEEITIDDLPALTSDEAVIRGETASITKEFYFFREIAPEATGVNLTYNLSSQGGEVELDWNSNDFSLAAGNTLEEFNIYYGNVTGSPYPYSITVPTTSVPHTLTGLENGQEYCFAVTAVTEDGEESDYSNQICATPEDTQAPAAPNISNSVPEDGRVKIAWSDLSSGEAVMFKVYYKATTNCPITSGFGNSVDIPYQTEATSTISGLANGVEYCFAMVSVDENGNESDPDQAFTSSSPFAYPANLAITGVGTSTVGLRWSYTDGSGDGVNNTVIFYGTSTYDYASTTSFASNIQTTTISNLIPNTQYYFNIKTFHPGGYESPYLREEEISTRPLP